ncbi:MAG TPA: hypothetical protein VK587_17370 [bacterium]|nr:hypothetical protein [bacterium]
MGVAALDAAYLQVAHRFIRTSDDARIVLEAQDLLRGNWNLRGWVLTSDNFWPSEALWYVPAVARAGPVLALLFQLPSLVYALLVAASCALAARPYHGWAAASAATLTFLVIGLPPALWGGNFALAAIALRPAIHLGTMLLVLAALLLVDPGDETAAAPPVGPHPVRFGAAAVLFGCAIAGDPIAGWMVWVPCALVVALDAVGPARRQAGAVVVWLAASLVLAGALLSLAASTGGFVDVHSDVVLTAPGQTGPNLLQFVRWWFALGGGDVLGLPAAPQTVLVLGRSVLCAVVLWCVGVELTTWIRHRRRGRWLDAVLAAAVVVSAAEMVLSTQGSQSRYVVPALFCGAILAGRRAGAALAAGPTDRRARGGYAALALAAVVSIPAFLLHFLVPPAPQPELPVARWLQEHRLSYGYGAYWDASIMTVETAGRVAVRPVVEEQGRLTRWLQLSSARWYTMPPQFVVFTGDPAVALERGMTVAAAARTLGGPVRILKMGAYTVVVRVPVPGGAARPAPP